MSKKPQNIFNIVDINYIKYFASKFMNCNFEKIGNNFPLFPYYEWSGNHIEDVCVFGCKYDILRAIPGNFFDVKFYHQIEGGKEHALSNTKIPTEHSHVFIAISIFKRIPSPHRYIFLQQPAVKANYTCSWEYDPQHLQPSWNVETRAVFSTVICSYTCMPHCLSLIPRLIAHDIMEQTT